ncbi:putative inactive hydroxysteroid dehydrogenase-like protein 1 [Apostichopus japonicus]|uniref:Putative inactive hydroxysteroid dehydrogenase-like protein 1 n=1 Tax=Stichopus japonicus TaxID=307972 RepID=A0A2G8L4Z1_STIJA|nr:putative inactive hydroxysteroid dehydrogenase-like protein 1 [Apostichopus japonicus]
MAAAVDSFNLIFNQISRSFHIYQEGLALLGAYLVVKRTIALVSAAEEGFRVHLFPRRRRNLVQEYGQWAVVTGSTDGIGKAYALELASYGLNIILISRSTEKLGKVAKEIESSHGVQTLIIKADFGLGQEIYPSIADKLVGKEVGILVNNVGAMDYPQLFQEVPMERLWQLININIGAATLMSHLVLPKMVERRRGAIINISASASIYPNPQLAVYAACKTYLDYFSRALQYECRNKGIFVQSLMPSYVATKMTSIDGGGGGGKKMSLLMPSATEYVRHAVSTLGVTARTTGYWPHAIQMWIFQKIPEKYWLWGQSTLNTALRRQASARKRHKSGSRKPSSVNPPFVSPTS